MPACLSKDLISSYPASPIKIGHEDQEPIPMRKQQQQQLGIVSILGPNDTSRVNTTTLTYSQQPNNNSIRRTLSADMSSKKWLSNNGFSSPSLSPMMKRIGSSNKFQSLSEEKEMDPTGTGGGASFDAIWGSIQKKNNNEGDHQKPPKQFDTWSSIITSNKEDDASSKSGIPLPPAYIHPSVKRSTSALSEKSLIICTESLGSETGSDEFSSQSENSSEPEGDSDSDQQQQDQDIIKKEEELLPAFDDTIKEEIQVPKYNYYNSIASCKRVIPKSFPPPLPSLADRDGTNLHMRSHRQNGRLVLEAVSVPSKNCLRAQRQDGRLLLSLTATATSEDRKEINDQQLDQFEENERTDQLCETKEKAEEEEDKYLGDKDECNDVLLDKVPKGGSMIKMQGNNNNYYSGKPDHHKERFNKVITTEPNHNEPVKQEPFQPVHKGLASTLSQSLPPRPRAIGRRIITNTASATAASLNLNTYEYYWRKNVNKTPPVAAAATWPTTDACAVPSPKEEIKEWPKNKFINVAALNGKLASPIVDEKQQQQRESSSFMEVQKVRPFGGEYLVPLLKQQGCKEPRRSLLFWEPYCIATT